MEKNDSIILALVRDLSPKMYRRKLKSSCFCWFLFSLSYFFFLENWNFLHHRPFRLSYILLNEWFVRKNHDSMKLSNESQAWRAIKKKKSIMHKKAFLRREKLQSINTQSLKWVVKSETWARKLFVSLVFHTAWASTN